MAASLASGHLTPIMLHRLQFADWVPFPVPHVFKFFANPENLPRLMPAAAETHLDHLELIAAPPPPSGDAQSWHAAGVGSVLTTSFRIFPSLPLRARWIARITEFEWNHHFADVQQKGPFKRWHHRHEFLRDSRDGVSGTLVHDLIEYEVGFGPLGALANSAFIARQMRQTFTGRQRILPQLLA
jgi:ligand-binding SRPBCC domain-containing protein